MGLFTKKIGPVFLKESSDATQFIERMEQLLPKAEGQLKKEIEKQINLARYGEYGENNIAFELRNSGMDMYILHDIYLEIEGMSAQIDYIVITRARTYVIECKNLIGNIEIDSGGNFIRSYELFGKRIKEGIYSPITQNQRHLQVLKKVRSQSKGNFVSKMIFEKYFEDTYKSIVVLANPKTYLNAKYAKKEIKEQVIRADQLISYIRNLDAKCDAFDNMRESEMFELAKFYMENNKSGRSDYARKYEELVREIENTQSICEKTVSTEPNTETVVDATSREQKIAALKAFRLEKSREEKVKAYYIFNDAQMNELLDKNPRNKEELLKVSGFGPVKVEKYGENILNILRK